MKIPKTLLAGILAATYGQMALAVPFIDGKTGLKALTTGKGFETTLYSGSAADGDEHVIYVPWSRLEVIKDENGIPKFNFAYSRKGALMTVTLRATIGTKEELGPIIQQKKLAMIEEGIPAKKIQIAKLPVHKGVYRSTLRLEGLGEFIVATTEVQNSIPSNEVALSILMGRAAADLVVLGLNSPSTALGFNYTYDFPGRTTPYRAKVEIDWKSVYSYVREQFGFSHVAGSYQVDEITRNLTENKSITITVKQGDKSEVWDKIISDISKIVIARTFKAHHPKPDTQKLKLPKAQNKWVANFIMGKGKGVSGSGWNVGISAGYSLVDMNSTEQVTETINITAHPYRVFTATAGIQIKGYCDQYPNMFHYQGQYDETVGRYHIEEGCPTHIFGEKPAVSAQKTPSNNNAAIGQGATPPPKGQKSKLDQDVDNFFN
ncbi:hypothetical protein [Candidatus Parabeggiatoa sp. HSG14]|uniref:hypothetical protein n=1 Tax=Candidatus Parabeggiatoa sp. HSG14 TaxID=3055593 RepID=UPI0025A8034C|nr:hypothetical protein [Thiotrichales bacterium HSG14]